MSTRTDGDGRTVTATEGGALEGEDGSGGDGPGRLALPPRYADLGHIAGGGMGEIRRAHDRELDRVVAVKLMRYSRADEEVARRRFVNEARITAALQHPGVVPIHEAGTLPDGRPWFAMREIGGRTLRAAIEQHHALDREARGPDLRRLVFAYLQICQTVAYAHRQGVVHRDLKPDNVMIGSFGEVLVLDWGIAVRLGEVEGAGEGPPGEGDERLTAHGAIIGTPRFMAPEQARGELDALGPWTDVYALGAVLHHLLTGAPPGRPGVAGWLPIEAPLPPVEGAPAGLVAIRDRAMRAAPAERYPDAGALATAAQAWLDGSARRARARRMVADAGPQPVEAARLRGEAASARAEAARLAEVIAPSDPVDDKAPMWALEDRAAELDRAAEEDERDWVRQIRGALDLEPELAEAHGALADHYRARLVDAEARRDAGDAACYESHLRSHDRGRHAAFLRGDGALTLETDPPGATVRCLRYVVERRRLVPEPFAELGRTPLRAVALPRGSYLIEIAHPDCEAVRYPVLIERGACWDGVPPGEAASRPVPLPPRGALADGELYVPGGWCVTGGDPDAAESLPRRRVWVDGFVMDRDPVTNAMYRDFLDALVEAGQSALAERLEPRDPMAAQGPGRPIFERGPDGRYRLPDGEAPDWPVVFVDCRGADAYAAHVGRRLPLGLEWEKAARGVDGRLLPWGDHLDPSWTCIIESHTGPPGRAPVGRLVDDVGPYGHRGLVGNVRDICGDLWRRGGPPIEGGRLRARAADAGAAGHRNMRGGAWASTGSMARPASWFGGLPDGRLSAVGFRLAGVSSTWRLRSCGSSRS